MPSERQPYPTEFPYLHPDDDLRMAPWCQHPAFIRARELREKIRVLQAEINKGVEALARTMHVQPGDRVEVRGNLYRVDRVYSLVDGMFSADLVRLNRTTGKDMKMAGAYTPVRETTDVMCIRPGQIITKKEDASVK